MRIVIPLIESQYDNIELRYCLRSIKKHCKHDGITVIGFKPKWLTGVKHIEYPAALTNDYKEKNIYDKLCLVGGKFLYFNDDHYLLQDFTARSFPYYYSGSLEQKYSSVSPRNVYRNTILNTANVVGWKKQFFGLHCPILIDNLSKPAILWDKPFGYCLRSLYTADVGIEIEDLKLKANFDKHQIYDLINGRPFFSTAESAINEKMIEVFNELYPDKSKYEL